MAVKGMFESLSVKAQVRIIDLFVSTHRPESMAVCIGGMREWHVARCLNEYYGVDAVSRLSKKSYALSTKRVNPTMDDLMDVIFAPGDKLTILVTSASAVPGRWCGSNFINADIFNTIVKRFLDASVDVHMREFHISAPARGLVRPCPRCSSYQLKADEDQLNSVEDRHRLGIKPPAQIAQEIFHFHNATTGQWLTVELQLSDKFVQRENIRKATFSLVETPPCAIRQKLTMHRRSSLYDVVIVDTLQCLPRSEVEKCQLTVRRWRDLVDAHTRSLPLRWIFLWEDAPSELALFARPPNDDLMGLTLRIPFAPADGLSPSPSQLLRNANIDNIEGTDDMCKEIAAILKDATRDSDLRLGEVHATLKSFTLEIMDATLWLSCLGRLTKLEMDSIPFTAFVEHYKTIFDANGFGRARHLYLDIFCNDHNFQPPPSIYEDMRSRWLDFVFYSPCEEVVIVSRRAFSEGLQLPFNADDRFLSMKVVGNFTTCVIDAINVKRLPAACVKPIAARQTAEHLGFLHLLYNRVGNDLYDVYHIRNEHANADLSVLVGVQPWRCRVVLMRGKFEGGDPWDSDEEYWFRRDGEGGYEDHNDESE
ncbi:hypothetical protein AAVH_28847 [Aphelenchoides avenae]|nr:hypothetical protein AAVH_28847 [Aphelenchus avenae]